MLFAGLLQHVFSDVVFRVPTKEKILYLTFDDGPTSGITEQVLKMLQNYQAKATFFVCGQNAEKHQELLQYIIDEGHAVGNHTYSHLDGWRTKTHRYVTEVEHTRKVVKNKLFRPPYGHIRLSQYRYLRKRFQIVVWDVMCMDFNPKRSPECCWNKIITKAKSGSVIVFHDTVKAAPNMLYALEQTLIKYSQQGFHFNTLSDTVK